TQPKETAQPKEPMRVADANQAKSFRPNVIDLRTTPIAKRSDIRDVSVTKPTLQQVRDNPNLETAKVLLRRAELLPAQMQQPTDVRGQVRDVPTARAVGDGTPARAAGDASATRVAGDASPTRVASDASPT